MKKFDELDRKRVTREIEKHFKVSLKPIGKKKKYLQDETGRYYWILGGHEEWHGVDGNMIDEEIANPQKGFLIVAVRYPESIKIFKGLLTPLIQNKDKLSPTQKGSFQFHYKVSGNSLIIKEVPQAVLTFLHLIDYKKEEKDSDKNIEDFKKIFDKLTPEGKKEIIQKLNKQRISP